MTCRCNDLYCESCGPTLGNFRCPSCNAWSVNGACKANLYCETRNQLIEAINLRDDMLENGESSDEIHGEIYTIIDELALIAPKFNVIEDALVNVAQAICEEDGDDDEGEPPARMRRLRKGQSRSSGKAKPRDEEGELEPARPKKKGKGKKGKGKKAAKPTPPPPPKITIPGADIGTPGTATAAPAAPGLGALSGGTLDIDLSSIPLPRSERLAAAASRPPPPKVSPIGTHARGGLPGVRYSKTADGKPVSGFGVLSSDNYVAVAKDAKGNEVQSRLLGKGDIIIKASGFATPAGGVLQDVVTRSKWAKKRTYDVVAKRGPISREQVESVVKATVAKLKERQAIARNVWNRLASEVMECECGGGDEACKRCGGRGEKRIFPKLGRGSIYSQKEVDRLKSELAQLEGRPDSEDNAKEKGRIQRRLSRHYEAFDLIASILANAEDVDVIPIQEVSDREYVLTGPVGLKLETETGRVKDIKVSDMEKIQYFDVGQGPERGAWKVQVAGMDLSDVEFERLAVLVDADVGGEKPSERLQGKVEQELRKKFERAKAILYNAQTVTSAGTPVPPDMLKEAISDIAIISKDLLAFSTPGYKSSATYSPEEKINEEISRLERMAAATDESNSRYQQALERVEVAQQTLQKKVANVDVNQLKLITDLDGDAEGDSEKIQILRDGITLFREVADFWENSIYPMEEELFTKVFVSKEVMAFYARETGAKVNPIYKNDMRKAIRDNLKVCKETIKLIEDGLNAMEAGKYKRPETALSTAMLSGKEYVSLFSKVGTFLSALQSNPYNPEGFNPAGYVEARRLLFSEYAAGLPQYFKDQCAKLRQVLAELMNSISEQMEGSFKVTTTSVYDPSNGQGLTAIRQMTSPSTGADYCKSCSGKKCDQCLQTGFETVVKEPIEVTILRKNGTVDKVLARFSPKNPALLGRTADDKTWDLDIALWVQSLDKAYKLLISAIDAQTQPIDISLTMYASPKEEEEITLWPSNRTVEEKTSQFKLASSDLSEVLTGEAAVEKAIDDSDRMVLDVLRMAENKYTARIDLLNSKKSMLSGSGSALRAAGDALNRVKDFRRAFETGEWESVSAITSQRQQAKYFQELASKEVTRRINLDRAKPGWDKSIEREKQYRAMASYYTSPAQTKAAIIISIASSFINLNLQSMGLAVTQEKGSYFNAAQRAFNAYQNVLHSFTPDGNIVLAKPVYARKMKLSPLSGPPKQYGESLVRTMRSNIMESCGLKATRRFDAVTQLSQIITDLYGADVVLTGMKAHESYLNGLAGIVESSDGNELVVRLKNSPRVISLLVAEDRILRVKRSEAIVVDLKDHTLAIWNALEA